MFKVEVIGLKMFMDDTHITLIVHVKTLALKMS